MEAKTRIKQHGCYLFVLVMDELNGHVQDEIPWCMWLTDDLVLIVETWKWIRSKLEAWRKALDLKRLKIMRLDIGNVNLVTWEKQVMEQLMSRAKMYPKMSFYLGVIVHRKGNRGWHWNNNVS